MKALWSVLPIELRSSRLLVIYLALGLVGGLVSSPIGAIVNYVLLIGYVALITWWLRNDHRPTDIDLEDEPSAQRDIAVVIVVAALALLAVSWFWFGPGPRQLFLSIRDNLVKGGVEAQLARTFANAVVALAVLLLPAVVVVLAARLRPRQIALVPRRLGLGLVLCLIAFGLGLAAFLVGLPQTGWKGNHGLVWSLALFLAQAGINALPEEFIFRGIMLTRLLAIVRQPGTALVLSSVLFSAFHIPSHLAQPGHSPWWAVVLGSIVTPSYQPTGLIWGYLCYRTRSIWPGVLWHTSGTVFGIVFW